MHTPHHPQLPYSWAILARLAAAQVLLGRDSYWIVPTYIMVLSASWNHCPQCNLTLMNLDTLPASARANIYKTDSVHQELQYEMLIEPQREIPALQALEQYHA